MLRFRDRVPCLGVLVGFAIGLAPSAGWSDTSVGGALPKQSTWTKAGSPYLVLQNVEVPKGAALRIEPGVTVKSDCFSVIISGELIARGTEAEPIRFTSNRPSPQPQDWGAVQFLPGCTPVVWDADGQYQSGTILEHAVVEYGNGIVIQGCSPLIGECTVQFNAKKNGGGIFIEQCNPTIHGCRILHNQTEGNGGGICSIGGTPCLENNEISYNHARGEGGGIAADFSAPIIRRNTLRHNSAFHGGGIATGETILGQSTTSGCDFSRPTIVGNTLAGNFAASSGGGIHVEGSPVIRDNLIVNNVLGFGLFGRNGRDDSSPSARHDETGAGVYVRGTYGGPAVIERNQIVHNRGARWGGGLMLVSAAGEVRGNLLADNQAAGGGAVSAVMVNWYPTSFASSHGDLLQVSHNEITGNEGGGIEVAGESKQRFSVRLCNLRDNSPVDFQNHTRCERALQDVWMGSSDSLALAQKVFDYYDDQACGRVSVVPRTAPLPLAVSTRIPSELRAFYAASPQNLQAGVGLQAAGDRGVSVGLTWEAPTVGGAVGYRVFFELRDTYTQPPFSYTAHARQGKSPLDAGPNTQIRMTELRPNTEYSFVVVAYDQRRNESGFSAIVSLRTPAIRQ